MNETRRISLASIRQLLSVILLLLLSGVYRLAQAQNPQSQHPITPFPVIGNIYYVGLSNNTSFLITTPRGHILLDPTFEEWAPAILKHVEDLGFQTNDIKIILNFHAHLDHVGGLAAAKELTGANVVVMAEEADVIADGGKSAFDNATGEERWSPVRPDQVIRDEEKVQLGGVTMVAHLTAGHTKGCTPWTTVAEEDGRKYNVIFQCSIGTNARTPLIGNTKYPTIARDFAKSFDILRSLPVDVFLASHGTFISAGLKNGSLAIGRKERGFQDRGDEAN